MTSTTITDIKARQILDSRGRPTVEADVLLEGGGFGRAAVPSGASRGMAEAHELRDGDPAAWGGRGVSKAVGNAAGAIRDALVGRDAANQRGIDGAMISLDGTRQLERLGGNAILAVSLAAARAVADAQKVPLFRWLAELAVSPGPSMPMPMVNILSGGLHAGRGMDVQDFLAIPVGAHSYGEALAWTERIRSAATEIVAGMNRPTLLADEGGLSPGFERTEDALDTMMRAFERAELRPGEDAAIALDIAASSLMGTDGRYVFARAGAALMPDEMITAIEGWVRRYPIVSVEDGLHEDDWTNWRLLTERLCAIQVLGDDLFATQPDRIRRGIEAGAANCALIKINQNGTLTGAIAAIAEARTAGYATVVSARSGETEDTFIADLAVATGAGQIKIGSVRNSERLAKYNQLLRLEEEGLPFAGRSALAGGRR